MKFDITNVAALTRANGLQAYHDTLKEIREATLPILKTYQTFLVSDKTAMKVATESNRAIGGAPNKGWPAAVSVVLEAHLEKESSVEELIETVVPKEVDVQGIDSRSVQVAQYIDSLIFFSTYARQLAMLEVEQIGALHKSAVTGVLSTGEVKDILKDFHGFRAAYGQLKELSKANIAKQVKEVPDYVVGAADLEVVNATYGASKANPLAQNFISASWNPIFKLREVFNNRQIKRYHIAKEQRQNLEFRIQVLQQEIADSGKSPRLEQELTYHTGRLKRLNAELAEIEERAR